MSFHDRNLPKANDFDFDEFDFSDDILDENDLVELVQHTSGSQVPGGIGSGNPKFTVQLAGQSGVKASRHQSHYHRPQQTHYVPDFCAGEGLTHHPDSLLENVATISNNGDWNSGPTSVSSLPAQANIHGFDTLKPSQNQRFTDVTTADHSHGTYLLEEGLIPDGMQETALDLVNDGGQEISDCYDSPAALGNHNLHQPANSQQNEYRDTSTYDGPGTIPTLPGGPGPGFVGTEAVYTQIQALREELSRAQAKAAEAEAVAQTRFGEVLLLRGKLDQVSKQSAEKAAELEQKLAQSLSHHLAEIEALKGEKEKIAVNNKFLEHEIAQAAAHRPKPKTHNHISSRPYGSDTITPEPVRNVASTPPPPKQVTPQGRGDGFVDDNDHLQPVLPIQTNVNTLPNPGKESLKRTRSLTTTSPLTEAKPGSVRDHRRFPKSGSRAAREDAMLDIGDQLGSRLADKLGTERVRRESPAGFALFRHLLLHRTSPDNWSPFEALMSLYFPGMRGSAESKSVGSMLLEILRDNTTTSPPSSTKSKQSTDAWVSSVTKRILELWNRCLEDEYYDPIRPLVSLMHVVVGTGPVSVIPIVPLTGCATRSIDLVAIPVGLQLREPSSNFTTVAKSLTSNVPVASILSLLNAVATLLAQNKGLIRQFWSSITYDFILLMLVRLQPLPQILLMLKLLHSSSLETSFGAISMPEKQGRNESSLIDRLLLFLFELPSSINESQYSTHEILALRLSTLRLFSSFCNTRHGIASLTSHHTALPSLFCFLCSSILSLYFHRQGSKEFVLTNINLTARIVYSIIVHGGVTQTDIRQKISRVAGAEHQHLVSLTRLAFSDQLWIDGGIETEVAEAAHQLLDEYLSPEEGEKLLEIFPGSYSEG